MERTDVKVCVRPYVHQVIDEINRKPSFKKSTGEHFVTWKGSKYLLTNTGVGYVIWVDEQDD